MLFHKINILFIKLVLFFKRKNSSINITFSKYTLSEFDKILIKNKKIYYIDLNIIILKSFNDYCLKKIEAYPSARIIELNFSSNFYNIFLNNLNIEQDIRNDEFLYYLEIDLKKYLKSNSLDFLFNGNYNLMVDDIIFLKKK